MRDANSMYYYNQLPSEAKRVYKDLFMGLKGGSISASTCVHMDNWTTDDGVEFSEIVECCRNDFPEFFHLAGHYENVSTGRRTTVNFPALYSLTEYNALRLRMEQISDSLRQSLPFVQAPEREKYWLIHEWLVDHAKYYNNPKCSEKQKLEIHSITGPLLRQRSVCEGFAKAFKFFCDRAGLECIIVIGNKIGGEPNTHAWNMVRLGVSWYHIDTTWNIENLQLTGKKNDTYFLKNDIEMRKNHFWNEKKYPRCEAFMPNDEPLIISEEDMQKYILRKVRNKEYSMVLHCKNKLLDTDVAKNAIRKAMAWYPEAFVGITGYSIMAHNRMYLEIVFDLAGS